MHTITVSKIVNAPAAVVWASWDDYGNVQAFNPSLRSSQILSSSQSVTGPGAKRECEFADGRNWVREKIVDYVAGRRMTIEVYDGSLPLKRMLASIEVSDRGNHQAEVQIIASFVPKLGVVGQLMAPLMKRQVRSSLTDLLDSNATYVEAGRLQARAA
jgi:uncharacterized membrane protein